MLGHDRSGGGHHIHRPQRLDALNLHQQQIRQSDYTNDPLEMSPGFAWRGGEATTWRDPAPDTPASVFDEMLSPVPFDEVSEELQLHGTLPLYFDASSRDGRASLPGHGQIRSYGGLHGGGGGGRMDHCSSPHDLTQRPDSCPELSVGFNGLRTISTPSIPEHPLSPEPMSSHCHVHTQSHAESPIHLHPEPVHFHPQPLRSSPPPLLSSIHDFDEFVAPQPVHRPGEFDHPSLSFQHNDGWPMAEVKSEFMAENL
jgi:hypothetical protein